MIDLPECWFLEPDAPKKQVVISDVYRIDGIGDVSTDWTVGSEAVHKNIGRGNCWVFSPVGESAVIP